jgi:hypothetical protein
MTSVKVSINYRIRYVCYLRVRSSYPVNFYPYEGLYNINPISEFLFNSLNKI